MKIKYKTSTGEMICVGAMPNLTAGPSESIIDFDGVIPSDSLDNYTCDGIGFARKKQADIDSDVLSKKNGRKSRKQAIMAKLGITKQDVKHLIELIQDGNDD